MIFELTELEKVGEEQFKAVRKTLGDEASVTPDKILAKPELFVLAIRTCDGLYHKVNSDISDIFKSIKGKVRKTAVMDIATKLSLDENVHGQRFIIYNAQSPFLLGDVLTALKQLAR